MAARRVIADSDDEDDDFSPMRPASQAHDPRLDIEPLSPHHQPTKTIVRQHSTLAVSNHETSGSTNPSFFANVYDEQQKQALKQSNLIEDIVRLSQRASASSGEISSCAKGTGKSNKYAANARSLATDVISPLPLTKPAPRKSQLAQMSDATEFTTPRRRRRAGKDEWDVPSSGDEGDNQGNQNLNTTTDSARDEPGKFYVAASNLSASQRRQYRRVQISDSHLGESTITDSAGQMQPPSNHKSSGATTVAVSTPSRYASSGPRPPWEMEQPLDVNERSAIELTLSSPDAISAEDAGQADDESPVQRQSVKRKRPSIRDDDDELGQNEILDSPLSDLDPEFAISSRRSSKKAKQSVKSSADASVAEPKKRGRKKKTTQPLSEEVIHAEETQDVASVSEPAIIPEVTPEAIAEKPKKKRGRPRKSDAQKNQDTTDVAVSATKKLVGSKIAAPPSPEDTSVEGESMTIADSRKRSGGQNLATTEKNKAEADISEVTTRSVSPLKEADRNALLTSQSTISDSDKSMVKSSITPSQAGKSLYRVGLSKKSRIAPLLKIIRK